jgi:hypothetical protein
MVKKERISSFNGSSNYLQYSNGSFKPSHQFFSYSMWVKPSSLSGIQTIFEEGGTVNGAVRLNGSTAVREGSAQQNTGTFIFPSDGSWHHVALTYNNGNVILYLDGVALQPYLLDLRIGSTFRCSTFWIFKWCFWFFFYQLLWWIDG